MAALAVLAGMRQLGQRAPDDLAVVGVNNSAAAALADPPLTMVEVDASATARFVVDTITALLRADRPGPIETPVTSVVERR